MIPRLIYIEVRMENADSSDGPRDIFIRVWSGSQGTLISEARSLGGIGLARLVAEGHEGKACGEERLGCSDVH